MKHLPKVEINPKTPAALPTPWRIGLVVAAILAVASLAYWHFHSVAAEQKVLSQIKHLGVRAGFAESGSLAIANQVYLKQLEHQGEADLVKLIEITTALNVVQSSEIGVSFIADFNVKVGQVLHDLNAAFKRAIEVNLLSIMALKVIALAAQVAHLLAPYLFWSSMVLWAAYALLAIAREKKVLPQRVLVNVRMSARHLTMLFVIAHLLLPYSLHFSGVISEHLNHTVRGTHQNNLAVSHQLIVSSTKDSHLKSQAESSIHHLKSLSKKQVHSHTQNMLSYVMWLTVQTFFNLVLMPSVLLISFYFMARNLMPRPEKWR